MIPCGDLRRAYLAQPAEFDAAIAAVLADGQFVLGERLRTLEAEFAAYCGSTWGVGVGNGTDAIALALRACGVAAGDEVITTSFSAAFTALGICMAGAQPIFADIDPQRFTLDPDELEARLTPRTRAVVPVHLYGQPADMAPILAFARRHGLAVIEDAAQAHGARYRGQRVGSLGDAAAFSFYPTKNLGAFGDAGMVITSDPEIARRLRMLRDGGQSDRYRHELVGVNSRLDELQAAVLLVRLGRLEEANARRRAIAARYAQALAGQGAVTPPWIAPDSEPVYHQFVVRCRLRQRLAAELAARGVGTAIHYPTPIHLQPAFGGAGRRGEFPAAERAAEEVLSLPVYPELSDAEVAHVAGALAEVSESLEQTG